MLKSLTQAPPSRRGQLVALGTVTFEAPWSVGAGARDADIWALCALINICHKKQTKTNQIVKMLLQLIKG